MRSFLCGLSLASHYALSAIATKTYYNLEMWLSLPGAILLYGLNSVIGYGIPFGNEFEHFAIYFQAFFFQFKRQQVHCNV